MVQRDDSISEHLDTLLDALTHVRNKTEEQDKTIANFVNTSVLFPNSCVLISALDYLAWHHDQDSMYTLF